MLVKFKIVLHIVMYHYFSNLNRDKIMKPLEGIRVLDFSTLLPGPLASLILSEAGAEVIKIEKPGGEDMRRNFPQIHGESVLFAMLNRGKKSIEINLKEPDSVKKLMPIIESSDILLEQFRPGVMDKLGLGWNVIKEKNPKMVYCAITGYGQTGPRKDVAAHDINCVAESGLLSLSTDKNGAPFIPVTQIADIAAGSYPAVMNILLALFRAKINNQGSYIDISMTDNLFPLMWMGLSLGLTTGKFPEGNELILNGSSARYNIYKTKDNGFVALGALEDKFWNRFCEVFNVPENTRKNSSHPSSIRSVAEIIVQKDTIELSEILKEEKNICCSVVPNIPKALTSDQIKSRKLFENIVNIGEAQISSVPMPIVTDLKKNETQNAPSLGADNNLLASV